MGGQAGSEPGRGGMRWDGEGVPNQGIKHGREGA